MKSEKPIVVNYGDNRWEFIYPPTIENEKVGDVFWEGVELLDYDDKKAEEIFKRLISKYPYYIDAYNHLSIAFRNQGKSFESTLTAEKSYKLGKDYFPKGFNFKRNELPWSSLSNRPFLRACQTYGLECQLNKDYSQAAEIFKENLTLNKNDNQGIRYLLLEIYLATQNYTEAKKIIRKYPDDYSIEFKYGIVVLNVIAGNLKQADKDLKDALKVNKFFLKEAAKDRHIQPPPHRIPGEPFFDAGIPIGSIQEAFDYWSRNKEVYKLKQINEYFKKMNATLSD